MITESFDNKSEAIINPIPNEKRAKCDICIATFSHEIEEYVVANFKPKIVGFFKCVNGAYPFYAFKYKNLNLGFYKTLLGAPASVGILEDATIYIDTNKFLVFGSAGSLDKEICHNKVVVPTYAYRDEGTSYHYAKAKDYIKIKNAKVVEKFMKNNKIPYVVGKVWTTDAFYRETKNNFKKRKDEGCIAVEMECSALQAVCDFRGKELYYFLVSGDLLDAPEWEKKKLHEANHNLENFQIALKLAQEICKTKKSNNDDEKH